LTAVVGFVEKVTEYPSKFKGKDSAWAAIVDNVRYSFGFSRWQPVKEGEYVGFEASQDAKGYWVADLSTIKKEQAPAKQTGSSSQRAAASSGVAPAGDLRQDSIIYQSQGTRAVAFVDMLLRNSLVDFGKAKGAQKIELVEVYVDHYTKRFFDDVKRLAPPEHESPVDAEAPAEVTAIAKPPRKKVAAPAAEEDEGDFADDVLPF